eukprot:scaffold3762_cov103-Skeletonema_marinoi.AAC.1
MACLASLEIDGCFHCASKRGLRIEERKSNGLSGRPAGDTRQFMQWFMRFPILVNFQQIRQKKEEKDVRPSVANPFLSHQRGNSLSSDLSNESKSRGVAGLISPHCSCATTVITLTFTNNTTLLAIMADEEDIAALVIDNGSGMCKG